MPWVLLKPDVANYLIVCRTRLDPSFTALFSSQNLLIISPSRSFSILTFRCPIVIFLWAFFLRVLRYRCVYSNNCYVIGLNRVCMTLDRMLEYITSCRYAVLIPICFRFFFSLRLHLSSCICRWSKSRNTYIVSHILRTLTFNHLLLDIFKLSTLV